MINEEQLLIEKKYLLLVKKVLHSLISQQKVQINKNSENVLKMKKFMWQNFSEYNDVERQCELNLIDNDVDAVNTKIKQVLAYQKALDNPYFAKIVFNDKQYHEKIDVYIGMKSVENKHEFLVYDWRAPISSLFYNFELGNAYYDSPMGQVHGKIDSKMQFKINNGELIRCFNSDINIDDDYLQEILASASTNKMKNIVSTIQREQNEIIRNMKDKYLIVQGVAGSGKTSVAMHRIAYLLYQNLNLSSNNILIFSPNDIFSDYIANVLPELGEENVLTTTFSDFAKTFLKQCKNIESYTEFLERVYSFNEVDNQDIEYKMSDKYINDISNFIENIESNISFENEIIINGVTITTDELKTLFLNKYKDLPLIERIDMLAEHISDYFKYGHRKNKQIIKKHLIKNINLNFDIFEIYNNFLEFSNLNSNKFLNNSKIYYEDINPLLYIYFYIYGYPNYNNIKQIVIDEAQDYTYLQIKMLKTIFKNAQFTILGDINQTINPFYKYNSMNDISSIFPNSNYLELTKTYRSSKEIIDYSNKVLGVSNICSVRNENSLEVEINDVDTADIPQYITSMIEQLKAKEMKKIAIITKSGKFAKKIYDKLNDGDIQLINKSDSNILKEVVIIPSYLSKGLEFDCVISCNDADDNYTDDELNLYYVVCTRAQHALAICNEPTKILKKIK